MELESEVAPAQRALAWVRAKAEGGPVDGAARVTIHFHPDRPSADGRTVLERLVQDHTYRSQFETKTSNGGLTAAPGLDRWRWESRLFGGAYDEVPSSARPVYGSLNFRHRRNGGSPRFGSAYLRLQPEALARTTLCYPDSVFEPVDVGTAERARVVDQAAADVRDFLDDYVEAHVHGGLQLSRDVEALVLDPCYRNTEVEITAELLPCAIEWHAGFVLDIDDVVARPDFRTSETVALAKQIARRGQLDARILGEAAAGADAQTVKYLWHYIARFGRPSRSDDGELAIGLA